MRQMFVPVKSKSTSRRGVRAAGAIYGNLHALHHLRAMPPFLVAHCVGSYWACLYGIELLTRQYVCAYRCCRADGMACIHVAMLRSGAKLQIDWAKDVSRHRCPAPVSLFEDVLACSTTRFRHWCSICPNSLRGCRGLCSYTQGCFRSRQAAQNG